MNPSSRPPRSDAQTRTPSRYWFGVMRWSLLILLGFELIIRVFVMRLPLHVYKPEWGFVPHEGSCLVSGTEGLGITCYAANGEIETPHHDGVSVVVLGDSYTKASQVGTYENYVSLAEMALWEADLAVDLHNLGESRRTLADSIYMAPAINAAYSPQVVVVQTNASGLLDADNPQRENHFTLKANDGGLRIVHITPPRENLAQRNLIGSSGILSLSEDRWKFVREQMLNMRTKDNNTVSTETLPIHPQQIRAEVRLLTRAYPNSKIILLLIPGVPLISDGSMEWINPQDQAILSALEGLEGVTVLYPARQFRRLYEDGYMFPRGFSNTLPNIGHLNRYGHRAVAVVLAEALETLLK